MNHDVPALSGDLPDSGSLEADPEADRVGTGAGFWLPVLALVAATRGLDTARYLSIDNVNLALAIEHFDPLNHQPQPPGYPFFVLLSKVVDFVVGDPWTTFFLITIGFSAASLWATHAVAARMFSSGTGRAAVLMLVLNPVFWFGAAESPLRPSLALFSLLTAYCGWRAWNGEARFVYWGAAALAIGSGFRPDLLAYALPVWLVSSWMGTKSVRLVAQGLTVLAGIVLVWVGALVWASGGVGAFSKLVLNYLVDQSSGDSVVLGAQQVGWMRQFSRLVLWNGLAIVGWIWTLPWIRKSAGLLGPGQTREITFFAVWLLPGLAFQGLVHVAAPGHTLFSIPVWCILGAALVPLCMRHLAATVTVILGIMVFMNFFALRLTADSRPDVIERLTNIAYFSIGETSRNSILSMDNIARETLDEIRTASVPDRPNLIVTVDSHRVKWILNWRIARYYLPDAHFVVLADNSAPAVAHLVRDQQVDRSIQGETVRIPVPRNARLIWVLEPGTSLATAVERAGSRPAGQHVRVTDLTNTGSVTVPSFEFVPQ